MRLRHDRENISGQEEENLEQSIRDLAHGDAEAPASACVLVKPDCRDQQAD